MSNVCILTDSTVQFTHSKFPGFERVFIIPFVLQNNTQEKEISSWGGSQACRLLPPSSQEFIRFYTQLGREFDTIFVFTLSSLLNPVTGIAYSASRQYSNHAKIIVIDSQTTGAGLGLLVQEAAGAAAAGETPVEIERRMRMMLPHIYMLICIPELKYLAHAGYLDYSQALVGEMMGVLPIFSIEEGRLVPMEKVRTHRHLFESFVEFINEFDAPGHIAMMRGANLNSNRTRSVRQYIEQTFPETPFSDLTTAPPFAALFGQQSIALTIMEKLDQAGS